MKRATLALALVACGPGAPEHPQSLATAADQLGGSDAQIRAMMYKSVDYGGLRFADAACEQEFLVARTIPDAELDAFARCLAGLHLGPDTRRSSMPDFALLTYAPGVEIEARLNTGPNGMQLVWIGYLGSADGHASLPTVSPTALEQLRTGGDPHPHMNDLEDSWFKLCLDRDGAITGVHPIATISDALTTTITTEVSSWTFRPFVLGGSPAPVCSWLEIAGAHAESLGSVPIAPLDPAATSEQWRPRIGGNTTIAPTDEEKTLIQRAGVHSLAGTLRYCVAPSGEVSKVEIYASTGLPLYDKIIVANVLAWKFEPADRETCAALSMIYVQN